MTKLRLSPQDVILIKGVLLAQPKAYWEDKSLKTIKKKIKNQVLSRTKKRCCYCGLSQKKVHGITIDIEHILPKHRFTKYAFNLKNLSASCKRCNLQMKNKDYSFFNPQCSRRPFRSRYYTILHPNLDAYDRHIKLLYVQTNSGVELLKYWLLPSSTKAKTTYDYFRLSELEEASVDAAQADGFAAQLADLLPGTVKMKLWEILSKQ